LRVSREGFCKVITLAPRDTVHYTMFCKQTDDYKISGLREIMYLFALCKLNIVS